MSLEDDESEPLLSEQLEAWLLGPQRKTTGELVEQFGTQSFALVFLVLMAPSALPIPTGGITNVFEIVVMLLALELVVGRQEIWIPARWADREIPGLSRPRFVNGLVKRIRWVERFARPRRARLLAWRVTGMVYGVVVFVLTLAAFLALPFSGLDTLPSLGVVVLSLGMLFGDVFIAAAGVVIGAVGVGVVVGLGHAISRLF